MMVVSRAERVASAGRTVLAAVLGILWLLPFAGSS